MSKSASTANTGDINAEDIDINARAVNTDVMVQAKGDRGCETDTNTRDKLTLSNGK